MESRLKYVNGKYIKMTDEEISAIKNQPRDIQGEMEEIKEKLSATDYKCLKHIDGDLTDEEYEPVKLQRKEWRKQYNDLEAELNAQNG